MTTQVDDSVIEKIRKLLNLADGNKNVKEAENAILLAQKFLLQHNLTLADIKEKNPQDPELITHERIVEEIHKNDKQWRGLLLHVVTQNFLCKSLVFPSGYYLIGPEGNTVVAKELYEWLVSALTDIGKREYKGHKDRGGLYSKKTWSNSFYLGAISSIRSKLDQQREDLVQGDPIVLASEGLLKAYVEEHFNQVKGRSMTNFSQGAYNKGLETGRNLPTNPRRIID